MFEKLDQYFIKIILEKNPLIVLLATSIASLLLALMVVGLLHGLVSIIPYLWNHFDMDFLLRSALNVAESSLRNLSFTTFMAVASFVHAVIMYAARETSRAKNKDAYFVMMVISALLFIFFMMVTIVNLESMMPASNSLP